MVIHVSTDLQTLGVPLAVARGATIRKATEAETEIIRRVLSTLKGVNFTVQSYEFSFGQNGRRTRLKPDQWRYHVFEAVDYRTFEKVEIISSLLRDPIDLGIKISPVVGYNPVRLAMTLSQYQPNEDPESFGPAEAQSLSKWYGLFPEASAKNNFIEPALNNLHDVRAYPTNSNLSFLGLFTVIEGLLTYNPSGRGNPISNQIRAKMPLLTRLFERALDHKTHFKTNLESGDIWDQLYSLRSAIAHGGNPNFAKPEKGEKKSFHDLRSVIHAHPFVAEAAKLAIIAALYEPELLRDLHDV
jgi:hypothetical protein